MAWVRLDDQVPHNRKMLRAGPAACWLWVCGLAHCQRQRSDGFIAVEVLAMLGVPGIGKCEKLAELLVTVGLFERVDGGYQVHDYLHFNETAEEAAEREQQLHVIRAKSGRAGGLRSAEKRRLDAESSKQANGKQDSSNCLKQNEAPTRPDLISTPQTPLAGGRLLKRELRQAQKIRDLEFGCRHEPRCPNQHTCLEAIVRHRLRPPETERSQTETDPRF